MKGMLSFFKPSAFVKSFFVFSVAFFATLSISCKQLASFDPVVDGNQTVVGGGTTSVETTEFAFNLKATHGLVRKISLEWTAFSGAKYYEIYFAESSAAEFVKIGETQQPFFDDAVGAGRTGYFKVCAVKANGASTPFSSTVVGTSLAVPMISDGEVGEFEATISWSMENARGIDGTDYYEKSLKFEVVCQPKGGSDGENKVLSASGFSGSSYSYKFENLSSSQEYEFYVEAYLEGDTQSREKSPTVDKTTLTAYTPIAPKFSASEGDNAKGISLLITLPDMVTVRTFVKDSENPKERQEVPYPLCFEIYRKHEKAETYSQDSKRTLYYNGTELTKNIVEYQEAGAPYEAGKQVAWFDDDASLIGGEKYDYMIRSVPDINYSKTVCPDDKQYANEDGKITPVDKATTAQGWKSAPPSFNVKFGEDGGRTLSAGNTEVLSISFGFSAEWKDLGKAGDYKFAIKQNRTPWSGGSGTNAWLKNGETIFFETLDGINSCVQTFGSASGGLKPEEEGSYSYTLYIVSKNDEGTDDINSESNILDSMTARDKVVATKEVNLPKAELKAEGGYKDKVVLEIPTCEPNVTYKLERAELVDEKPTNEQVIDLNVPGSGVFKYEDKVDGNRKYSYVLKAIATSGVFALSTSQVAETLGTPDVSFRKEERYFGYDSVTISFDGVLAAKNYVVKLGASGGFGGGKEFNFASGFSGSTGNAEVSLNGNTYTVTVKGLEGYDNARLAGTKANVIVTAHSGVGEAPSSPVPVKVLGPAEVGATVNTFDEAKEDSITVSWNEVEGAKGYLIRRVMYSDAGMTKVAEESDITYYCDASGKVTLVDDEGDLSGRIDPSIKDGKFTLKDISEETDSTTSAYEKAQAKIAWGLPFRYVVLPVFDEKDFEFEGLKLAGGGKVAYKNLTPTAAAATFGYGLNLVAEKATSGNQQNIKWNKPHVDNAAATRPIVYRRVAGESGAFTRFRDGIDEVGSEKATMGIQPGVNADIGAYEYLVKYYKNGESTDNKISPPKSLLEEIAKRTTQYETPGGTKTEQDNKGYLLTIENFLAEIDKTKDYYEKISWTRWDYNTRAVGPDTMTIFIQNNNISADPKPAVEIVEANAEKTINYVGSDIDGASLGASSLRIKPKSVSDTGTGTAATDGLLKVLRDYKHNYTFELQRAGDEKPITVSNKDYDTSYVKTAYRQITNEELVKATMLILAAIEHDSNSQGKTAGAAFSLTGASGSFNGKGSGDSSMTWHLDHYKHNWKKLPSGDTNVPAFLTLNDQQGTKGRKFDKYFVNLCTNGSKGLFDGYAENFDIEKPISIDVSSEVYGTKTITVASRLDQFKATVDSSASYTAKETKNCRYWMPMEWYKSGGAGSQTSYGYFGEDPAYGWWPPSN